LAMLVTLVYSDKKAREKPCLRCGRSLRGVVDARHCPECGLAVWLSLGGNDALEWSNPPWLGRLSMVCGMLVLIQMAGMAAFWPMSLCAQQPAGLSRFSYSSMKAAVWRRRDCAAWVQPREIRRESHPLTNPVRPQRQGVSRFLNESEL